jgi:predicted transcriptional regulator
MSDKIEYWKELIRKGLDNRSREQGKYEMLKKRLKDEFDHESVEDLEQEIIDVTAEIQEKQERLNQKMEDFQNEFVAKLEKAAR